MGVDLLVLMKFFLDKIEELSLKHTTSVPEHNIPYIDAVLISGLDKFKKNAIKHLNGRKLVKHIISELCVSVMIDEYEITTSLNTEVYNVLEIYKIIKMLF